MLELPSSYTPPTKGHWGKRPSFSNQYTHIYIYIYIYIYSCASLSPYIYMLSGLYHIHKHIATCMRVALCISRMHRCCMCTCTMLACCVLTRINTFMDITYLQHNHDTWPRVKHLTKCVQCPAVDRVPIPPDMKQTHTHCTFHYERHK